MPQGQERAFWGKNTFQKVSFGHFHLEGQMTSGLGKQHYKNLACTSHSLLLGREQTSSTSISKIEIILFQAITKEDFLGRSHGFPIDQPLEGNIAQIHHNIKAKPKNTPKEDGGLQASRGNDFHWRHVEKDWDFYLWTCLTTSSDVRNGEELGKRSWPFFFPMGFCAFVSFEMQTKTLWKCSFNRSWWLRSQGEERSGEGTARQTDGMRERWKDVCRPRKWTFLDAFWDKFTTSAQRRLQLHYN